MIFEIIQNGGVIADSLHKKSDAQVGRVNTFHILQNIRKGP
jgi:hypothetical protein